MEFRIGLSSRMINNYKFHTLPDMRSSYFNPRTRKKAYVKDKLSMENTSKIRATMQPSLDMYLLMVSLVVSMAWIISI